MTQFKVFIFSIFFGSTTLFATEEFQFFFQNDLFIRKNSCGEKEIGYPKAIRIETHLPKSIIKNNLKITVKEANSNFSQTIIYNGSSFFYPGVFGEKGHSEYGMPLCEAHLAGCSFFFFVFDFEKLSSRRIWKLDIRIEELDSKKIVIEKSKILVKNEFSKKKEAYLINEIDFIDATPSKNAVALVSPQKIKKILKEGYNVDFIFSWRSTEEQIGYSEKFHNIKLDSEWIKQNNPKFPFNEDPTKPKTYLSFMIYLTKKNVAFETKIVILDNKYSDFFSKCKNPTSSGGK